MKILVFSDAEVSHILNLILSNEQNGEYYGPKDQYWKRSERIKQELKIGEVKR